MTSGITFDINIDGIFQGVLGRGGPVDRAMFGLANNIALRARVTSPRETFALADSIIVEPQGRLGYDIAALAPYAYWVHQGTKGGQTLTPKFAKAMRFRDPRTSQFNPRTGQTNKATGDVVYRSKVTRGATRAQPWLRKAMYVEIYTRYPR